MSSAEDLPMVLIPIVTTATILIIVAIALLKLKSLIEKDRVMHEQDIFRSLVTQWIARKYRRQPVPVLAPVEGGQIIRNALEMA